MELGGSAIGPELKHYRKAAAAASHTATNSTCLLPPILAHSCPGRLHGGAINFPMVFKRAEVKTYVDGSWGSGEGRMAGR